MKNNPNATIASGTAGVGIIVVWLLGYFGVDVSAEIGAVIAGGASAVMLYIGRDGIRGVIRRIWRGSTAR